MDGLNKTRGRQGGWLSTLLFGLSLALLAFGLFNLAWVVWPTPTEVVRFTIPAGVLPGSPAGMDYSSMADYQLSVSWPRWVRAGDRGLIQIQLIHLGTAPESSPPQDDLQVVLVEPAFPSLPVDPPGRVQVNIADAQDLNLTWHVDGRVIGEFPGKAYVSFGFYDPTLEELMLVPVAVVDISIQVMGLWGQGTGMALWFGVIGLVLWGTLFILGRFAQAK